MGAKGFQASLPLIGLVLLMIVTATVALGAWVSPEEEGPGYAVYEAYNKTPAIVWRLGKYPDEKGTAPGGTALSPDKTLVVARTYGIGGKIIVIDARTGEVIHNTSSVSIYEANLPTRVNTREISRIFWMDSDKLLLTGEFRVNGTLADAILVDMTTSKLLDYINARSMIAREAGLIARQWASVDPQKGIALLTADNTSKAPWQPALAVIDLREKRLIWAGECLGCSPGANKAKALLSPGGDRVAYVQFFMNETRIIVLSTTGQLLWSAREAFVQQGDARWSEDGRVLVVMGLEKPGKPGMVLAAYDAESGEKLWETRVPGVIYDTLSLGGGKVVGAFTGFIYTHRLEDGRLLARYIMGGGGPNKVHVLDGTHLLVEKMKSLVHYQVEPVGVVEANYTNGPAGIQLCITPVASEEPRVCHTPDIVPYRLVARLPEGEYQVIVPARSLILALTRGKLELPGIDVNTFADFITSYLGATGGLLLANVSLRDGDWVTVGVDLEEALRENLAIIEVRGPAGTSVLFRTGSPYPTEAEIPETGKILLLTPPGEYNVTYRPPGAPPHREYPLATIELAPGDHAVLEIPETSTPEQTSPAGAAKETGPTASVSPAPTQSPANTPSPTTSTQPTTSGGKAGESEQISSPSPSTTERTPSTTPPTVTTTETQGGGVPVTAVAGGVAILVIAAIALKLFGRE